MNDVALATGKRRVEVRQRRIESRYISPVSIGRLMGTERTEFKTPAARGRSALQGRGTNHMLSSNAGPAT